LSQRGATRFTLEITDLDKTPKATVKQRRGVKRPAALFSPAFEVRDAGAAGQKKTQEQ